MIQRITLIFFIFSSILLAQEKISIDALIKTNFKDENINIEKKSLILTKEEVKSIQTLAQSKIDSKIIRYYKINKERQTIGHAILLKKRIRTKNAAILYMVDANKSMMGIEIVSFKEPSEYKPSSQWQSIFEGKTSQDVLIAGQDIPTISGATLSARAIADTARLSLAIAEKKF